ncbi:quinone oxidoreductase-like protein 1 isoform X4 [Corapipo altera]|uniref:quinone oxidoreductase-like protein 1 isoform X4 n=1 Tax=Corapipo altera TaxID=415028 RepID=UPI000FD649D7|nr:quinone oxidoreductase-like protein 1 isoform X4 [Corapipo altera]
MKALFGQQNSPGEEMTFVFQERENLPPPGDHEVKVQVRACALSWVDTKLLSEIKLKKELVPVGREISGVVLEVGSKVTFFQPDDEVVGILPLDSEESGLCEVILVHEHYLVQKPEKVCWAAAAGTVRDGLRAYTALHYLAQASPGTTVLVLDGASPFGTIAVQLAQHRGAKVVCTAHSLEDKQFLERLRPPVARVIDMAHGKIDVAESCLEETGGLGVDIVLDAGGIPWERAGSGHCAGCWRYWSGQCAGCWRYSLWESCSSHHHCLGLYSIILQHYWQGMWLEAAPLQRLLFFHCFIFIP